MDVHSKTTRSFNMSRIRSKDTKPEMIVRRFLHSKGFRYRLHRKNLPGRPDIVLLGNKTAIFVHGCFWHGHSGCKYFVLPKTRTQWWREKIARNKLNDKRKRLAIKKEGWRIVTLWECELRSDKKEQTLLRLYRTIKP